MTASARPPPPRAAWVAKIGYAAAAATYLVGVLIRYLYLFVFHKPKDFVYSDMGMYVELGKRLARPGYRLHPYDVTHPPGLSELIAYFIKTDPSLDNLVRFQFVVTAAVPLLIGLFGWLAFDRKNGAWSLAIASMYFPFIDYGGYFLAEIYLTFTATATLVLFLGALRLLSTGEEGVAAIDSRMELLARIRAALRSPFFGPVSKPRIAFAIGLAAVGGFTFSLAMLMKMVAVPAILAFLGVVVVFTRTPASWKAKLVLAVALFAGAAPLSRWQADRCTRGNEGKFCPGSNKAPADFLMGHIGRVQSVTWLERDPHRPERVRSQVNFGSPAAFQHGYQEKAKFEFKITDGEENKAAAWAWIRENPGQAVVLSFEHVWDSFGGSLPWPSVATKSWPASQAAHYAFLGLLLFPALMRLLEVARARGLVGLARSTELAVLAPIFGVVVSVMLATGEARYRIPWDMCFILVAVELYRGVRIRLFEPRAAQPPSSEATIRENTGAEDLPPGA